MQRLMLAALVLTTGCADTPWIVAREPGNRLGAWSPDFTTTILQTSVSQLADPTLTVVSDPETWSALWTRVWGGSQASPALPQVDFVLSSVVVVGLGLRTGLDHAVTIDSIVVYTVGSVLYGTESLPGANCAPSPGASAPVHIVHAPGHPPITDWRVGTIRRDCAP